MRFKVLFKAELTNVTDLAPADPSDFTWFIKTKCIQCGEDNKNWVGVSATDESGLSGSKGTANYVAKCKLCSKESSLDVVASSVKPYTADDSGKFAPVVSFETRGLEVTAFDPRSGFSTKGAESGTSFEVDFGEDAKSEWADYDEAGNCEVSILEVETKVVRE